MDKKPDLTDVLQAAKMLCERHGGKLTTKRLSVLEVLLIEQKPLTAYELADLVSRYTKQVTKPMSIYRILAFLVGQHLAHRLNMTHKYVACSMIHQCDEHGLSQFLICSKCEQVQEVAMSNQMYRNFQQQISGAGCIFNSSHIELEVVCSQCQTSEQSASSSNYEEPNKEENGYASSTY
jgi:Fur family zinc uptake transcriptional regulator